MNDELLPIGSVVRIRFSKEKFIIIGYYIEDKKKSETYEYVAVTYPLGLLSLNEIAGFDGSMIKKVIYKGFDTESGKTFREGLKEEIMALKAKGNSIDLSNVQKLGE